MVERPTLPNPPLVEALVELRWRLAERHEAPPYDPHYKFLLGRLQERVGEEYPFIEALPTSLLPEEFAPSQPTYRFRTAEGAWPLVQIGPGVFTINETESYDWKDFRDRVIRGVHQLFDVHPKKSDLRVENLLVRYINAEPIEERDFLSFLRDELKISVEFPKNWFVDSGVQAKPSGAQWISQFKCGNPPGLFSLTLALGQKSDTSAVMWDLSFRSQAAEIPRLPDEFEGWFVAAHDVIESWFFNLIEGSSLEAKYSSASSRH